MKTRWPTLYKKSTKTGKVQQWDCAVQSNVISVIQGQIGGAKQLYTTYCRGVNVGKVNATTDDQQALLEAQSKWEKQKKKGYVEDISGESELKLPMRVSTYQDNLNKITFPCTVSPKLNGVNAEARLVRGSDEIILLSRGGEEYILPEHWRDELLDMFEELGVDSLNGEVYKHGEWLQDITGAMKKHRLLTDELEFHVFDLPTHGSSWEERLSKLDDLKLKLYSTGRINTQQTVFPVTNSVAHSHEEIEEYHAECVAEGYEGIIIRNMDGLYQYNTRSNDVFKTKVALSEEFLVTGYSVDKYKHPVFTCEAKGGSFKVKPKGTDGQRKAILEEADNWIGEFMTVEFESYSKAGKPTKPVGIGLREGEWDESTGVFVPSI